VTLTSPGKISSPNYQSCQNTQYTDGLDCSWYIYSQGNSNIHVYFSEFLTEQNYDFVIFYDFVNNQWQETQRYSGTHTNLIKVSSSDRLRVRFTSDGSNTDQGFSATFFFGTYAKIFIFT